MGDGIRMAAALGARLCGMDRFYGHLLGREVFGNEKLWPYPILDHLAAAGVLVDARGRRFCDEGLGGVYMANETAKLGDPRGIAVVFDEAAWATVGADRSEEHTSELQSLMRISYAVFCLKKKKNKQSNTDI